MVKKIIRCSECNHLISYFESFGDFENLNPLPGVEWSAEDHENRRVFFQRHGEHLLEELVVDPDSYVSDKPSYECSKVSYFEASNGQQRFLIRRTKGGLDRPAAYHLIPGKLQVSNASFEIQEEALRRQMSLKNGKIPVPEEKIRRFIQALREEIENISPEKFAEELEMTQEGETPLLAYGRLKKAHWETVLRRCQKEMQETELNQIRQFIKESDQVDDILSVLIKRKVSILPLPHDRADPSL